jgi:hypothetical protein
MLIHKSKRSDPVEPIGVHSSLHSRLHPLYSVQRTAHHRFLPRSGRQIDQKGNS